MTVEKSILPRGKRNHVKRSAISIKSALPTWSETLKKGLQDAVENARKKKEEGK